MPRNCDGKFVVHPRISVLVELAGLVHFETSGPPIRIAFVFLLIRTTSLPSAFIEYITRCRVVSELLQRTVISGHVDTKAIRPFGS